MDDSTRLAMGIDFSSLALHVAYGGGIEPYRLVLRLDSHEPEDRCTEVAVWLNKLLATIERQYEDLQLTVMAIEKPWMGVNTQTLITLCQIQAACIVTCQLRDWFVFQQDPSVIRKKILGVGTVSKKGGIKKLAQEYVRKTHAWEVDGDTADSIVIWHYAKWAADHAELSFVSA
jgi:Holliday junction resolvasome RuvABC endonuclease subunit